MHKVEPLKLLVLIRRFFIPFMLLLTCLRTKINSEGREGAEKCQIGINIAIPTKQDAK